MFRIPFAQIILTPILLMIVNPSLAGTATDALAVVKITEMPFYYTGFCDDDLDTGVVCYMTYMLAERYCAEVEKTNLPTARDFAELAVARGALAVSPQPVQNEYNFAVEAVEPKGKRDRFFLAPGIGTYQRPQGEPESLCLWSSSRDAVDVNSVYGFNNNTGFIVPRRAVRFSSDPTDVSCAVACRVPRR